MRNMVKYCKECKVNVTTKTATCPLCKTPFEKCDPDDEVETYPPYRPLEKRSHIITKIFFFVTFIVSGLSVMLNLMMGTEVLWCIIVVASMLYLWLIVQYTFMTRVNLGLKLLTHAVALPAFLAVINLFSDVVIQVTWALAYAIPFILVAFALTITITVAMTKMKWRDYTLYMISISVLGFIPLVFALTGLATPYWPSIVSACYSFATLLGMFLFMDKRTKNELRKRFHL